MDRLVELIRYFPDYLRSYPEILHTAEAEGEEIKRLYGAVDTLWNNGYIQTADYTGIKRWESLLSLKPYPGDSLEERRASVLLKWNQQLPYTLPRLRERLETAVRDAYELEITPSAYRLEIRIIDQTYRVMCRVREMIRNMIPANILFIQAGAYPVWYPVQTSVSSRMELLSDFYARYNRKFLYLDGTWQLDGTYKLNGYKEIESPDLYPTVLTTRGSWTTECRTRASGGCMAQVMADTKAQSATAVAGGIVVQNNSNAALRILKQMNAGPEAGFHLTVEKDLWHLDGSYMLDGSKLLDAEIFYYD